MKNIYIVGAGPGDIELISLKGKRIIDQADYIFTSNRYVNQDLFQDVKKGCKIYDTFSRTYDEKLEMARQAQEAGRIIVFVTMGDSSLYGMIGGLVARFESAGLDYEIVAGLSSFNVASARLGRSYTGLGQSNTAIATSLKGSGEELDDLARLDATVTIFMGLGKLGKIVEIFSRHKPGDYPVAVLEKIGWEEEKIIISQLDSLEEDVARAGIGEGLIVLGKFINQPYDYDLEKRFEEEKSREREAREKKKRS